jgi:hypothetical protein
MTNASVPNVIGILNPDSTGVIPNVFIGTVAVVEVYCPVMYMFRDESTAIAYPVSVLAPPLLVEYPASVPFDPFHLMTNVDDVLPLTPAGKLTPDAVGAVPKVFIGAAVDM